MNHLHIVVSAYITWGYNRLKNYKADGWLLDRLFVHLCLYKLPNLFRNAPGFLQHQKLIHMQHPANTGEYLKAYLTVKMTYSLDTISYGQYAQKLGNGLYYQPSPP